MKYEFNIILSIIKFKVSNLDNHQVGNSSLQEYMDDMNNTEVNY